MRLSQEEARLRAVSLADRFLSSTDTRGWEYKCISANPERSHGGIQGRKTCVNWVVIVEWSKNGVVFDGPGVLTVNIQTEECELNG